MFSSPSLPVHPNIKKTCALGCEKNCVWLASQLIGKKSEKEKRKRNRGRSGSPCCFSPLKGWVKCHPDSAPFRLLVAFSAKQSLGQSCYFQCRAGADRPFHMMRRALQLLLSAQASFLSIGMDNPEKRPVLRHSCVALKKQYLKFGSKYPCERYNFFGIVAPAFRLYVNILSWLFLKIGAEAWYL